MRHEMQGATGLGARDKRWDRVRGAAAAQGVGWLTVQWPALVQKSGAGAESGRPCTPNEAIQKEQAGELRNPHPGVLRRGRNRPAAEPCRRSSSAVIMTGRLPAVHRPLSGLCGRWRGAVRHDRRQPAGVRELPGPPRPGCWGRRAPRRPSPWLISVGRERGWRAHRCLGKHDRDSNAAQPGKSSIHLL